jgi:hypothetical protein
MQSTIVSLHQEVNKEFPTSPLTHFLAVLQQPTTGMTGVINGP